LNKKYITEDEQKSCTGCIVTSVNQMSSAGFTYSLGSTTTATLEQSTDARGRNSNRSLCE